MVADAKAQCRRDAAPDSLRGRRLELIEVGRSASVAVEQALVETIAARLANLSPEQLEDLARGLALLDGVFRELEPAGRS